MATSYQILLDGTPADDDFYTALAAVEVEENMDLPGAIELKLPVNRSSDGELTRVSDDRLAPLANIAVVASPPPSSAIASAAGALASALGAGGASTGPQCIFDGYVLSHKLHLQTGTTDSTLAVWGQDASWLMNLEEKVREWVDVTDADVANTIFGEYGIAPSDANTADDSPSHVESGHTLMQRASDIQFLRSLARRNGKSCRVACIDKPGQRTGYFARPDLGGEPAAVLKLNGVDDWIVDALDLEWDAGRPTAVVARQALFTDDDTDGAAADTSDTGLPLLGDVALADFTGKPMKVVLTTPVDDGGELALRARALLRDASWFVRCEGEVDAARLGAVLRAGMVVRLDGIGAVYSGRYLVWTVRHTITADAHRMRFVLVRNAVGRPASGGVGGLAALAGGIGGAP
jgi:phage protein D